MPNESNTKQGSSTESDAAKSRYLSDKRPSGEQLERLKAIIRANGYQSN